MKESSVQLFEPSTTANYALTLQALYAAEAMSIYEDVVSPYVYTLKLLDLVRMRFLSFFTLGLFRSVWRDRVSSQEKNNKRLDPAGKLVKPYALTFVAKNKFRPAIRPEQFQYHLTWWNFLFVGLDYILLNLNAVIAAAATAAITVPAYLFTKLIYESQIAWFKRQLNKSLEAAEPRDLAKNFLNDHHMASRKQTYLAWHDDEVTATHEKLKLFAESKKQLVLAKHISPQNLKTALFEALAAYTQSPEATAIIQITPSAMDAYLKAQEAYANPLPGDRTSILSSLKRSLSDSVVSQAERVSDAYDTKLLLDRIYDGFRGSATIAEITIVENAKAACTQRTANAFTGA